MLEASKGRHSYIPQVATIDLPEIVHVLLTYVLLFVLRAE